ncbi:disintegrin and metalloproteinase domain-containing protein 25-like [Ochotona curzoniae]|uniref:disintegrin and metalloproteinase domain-containing protein 25-like n=1 Tax=Ochotona curzoniae TaxID=130825 RepID=UPI001B34D74B|nr:disintegrin and metalloproteinase domain-containing protein 25-like [Ochotona curzoniae]
MRISLLMLWVGEFFLLSGWLQTGHCQHHSHPEVVIPLRVTGTEKDMKTKGWLSYRLQIAGHRYILHTKVKKNVITRHFSIFTYSDQGALIKDQPFVREGCYYHGYVEGDPESMVAVSTCFGGFQGMLQINDTIYEIKPKPFSSKFEHLVYKVDSEDTMTCGLTEEEIAQQLKKHKPNNPFLMQSDYQGWWTHRWFIELAMVVDQERFFHKGSNISAVEDEVIELINLLNSVYEHMDVELFLPGIEIWNEGNPIPPANISYFLTEFCKWKRSNLDIRMPHDVVHLLIKAGFGIYLGLAYVGTVCNSFYNCAVNSFRTDALVSFSYILAHELGHNLGIYHDTATCKCKDRVCIMYPTASAATKFSNCSYAQYWGYSIRTHCMRSPPNPESLFTKHRCGNAVVEEEEKCDCGSLGSCTNDPCCSTDCTLVPGASCAFGSCCKDCQFVPSGQVCREQGSECDLPEWCNGTWHECPDDVYVQDGSPCLGMGYCYEKRCNFRDEQCRKIFGKKARSANEMCYREMNTRGDRFGNCGTTTTAYRACAIADILCGRIQCENVTEIPSLASHSTVHITRFAGHSCWGVDYHFGMTALDIGDVKDGTECGKQRVCIHRRCVPEPVWDSKCIPEMCNMHGICNSKHHCHCGKKWAPPNCRTKGNGGSIDSGPPPEQKHEETAQKREPDRGISKFWIPFLVFLNCVLILCCCCFICSPLQKKEDTPEPPEQKSDLPKTN